MTMVVEYPNWVYKFGIFLPKSDQTKSKSFIFFVMEECGVDKIWLYLRMNFPDQVKILD